jgi:hypothetical protein
MKLHHLFQLKIEGPMLLKENDLFPIFIEMSENFQVGRPIEKLGAKKIPPQSKCQ